MKFTAVLGLFLAGLAVAELPYQVDDKREDNRSKPWFSVTGSYHHLPTGTGHPHHSGSSHHHPSGTGHSHHSGSHHHTGTVSHHHPSGTGHPHTFGPGGIKVPTTFETFKTWKPIPTGSHHHHSGTGHPHPSGTGHHHPSGTGHHHPSGTGHPHPSGTHSYTKPHQPTEQPTRY